METERGIIAEINDPFQNNGRKAPFPFGFAPTLHRYRLDEPSKIKTPQTIFVCSMADLFGEWVPDEWIQAVFTACEAAPQHRYLFLTKNPERYLALHESNRLPTADNFWYGFTVTRRGDIAVKLQNINTFVSVEPISERINPELPDWDISIGCNWVIIGAETGNRKGKVIPEKSWIDDFLKHCKKFSIPIFMKESLRELMGTNFVQEYPWEAK
jgi:protein gp37